MRRKVANDCRLHAMKDLCMQTRSLHASSCPRTLRHSHLLVPISLPNTLCRDSELALCWLK